jgi:sugar lactone lactonase YvrE
MAGDSGLPSSDILSLAEDPSGRLWVGTAGGITRYDGATLVRFKPTAFGLRGDRVNALGVDNAGRVWLGTDGGAATFNGEAWVAYTSGDSGLRDNYLLSLAIDRRPTGDVVWFGHRDGISRFDTASGQWSSLTSDDAQLGSGGVGSLYLDSAGRLWAGSLGGGVSRWDGTHWTSFRTSNSGLPNETVQAILETEPGVMWIGTALPFMSGGTLSRYDGSTWRHYTAENSGYSGAEPLTIATDAEGRLWVGTQTAGVDVLRLED